MNSERIAKMTENIVAEVMGEENPQPSLPNLRTEPISPDEDVALANTDQAIDAMIAALMVLDDNLPNIKTDSIPERAACDAAIDLLETGVKPYFADMIKALQVLK